MTLANDSILVTPGVGATVAMHDVGGKEHQVYIPADDTGHLLGSKDTYFYRIPTQVHVNVANTVHWDLFNAGTGIVRVLSVVQIPSVTTTVSGVVFDWDLMRTTSVGTGGVVQTAWLPDTAQPALAAAITCRSKPTGGAAASTILRSYSINSEETTVATQLFATLSAAGATNIVPVELCPPQSWRGIVLRQNQGMRCVQLTQSAAGNTGWLLGFTVE